MKIRNAGPDDEAAIALLLEQLGYGETAPFLRSRIEELTRDPDELLVVGELEGRVVALLSLHFIPQLAVAGPFARISFLAVEEGLRSQGVGRQLEEHVEAMARARGCDRIELHCHSRRVEAHRFYFRQGYEESPKYLMKLLP